MTHPAPTPATAVLAALTATAVLAWLTVLLIPGAPAALRDQLSFTFAPAPADAPGALALAANNFKVCALAIVGAAAQQLYATSPRSRVIARRLFDVVLAISYAANAAQFGVAFGAYGARLLAWTPHVPLELCALAVSAGAYLRCRHDRPATASIIAAAGLAGLLVIAAAIIETWAVPHT